MKNVDKACAELTDRHEERGITSIEYGMMATAIAVFVAGGVFGLGPQIQALFESIFA